MFELTCVIETPVTAEGPVNNLNLSWIVTTPFIGGIGYYFSSSIFLKIEGFYFIKVYIVHIVKPFLFQDIILCIHRHSLLFGASTSTVLIDSFGI